MRTRGGFTLIELLVVISIIALLVAILLPVLSRARAVTQTVTCLSNLRQVFIANLTYTEDHSGYFPNRSAAAPRNRWWNSLGADGYLSGIEALRCPSQGGRFQEVLQDSNTQTTWTGEIFQGTIGMNLWLLMDFASPVYTPGGEPWKSWGWVLPRMHTLEQPGKTLIAADGDFWLMKPGYDPSSLMERLDDHRHQLGGRVGINGDTGINIAYGDGRAATLAGTPAYEKLPTPPNNRSIPDQSLFWYGHVPHF